jgi:DNA-binding transcriptional MerR regulator
MKTTMSHHAVAAAPPRKLFYRIHEVAQMTGLKPYVLRYWETEFRDLAPPKDASDQRRYRPTDIETVLTIRKLLYEDRFTIAGARKRLRDELRARRRDSSRIMLPEPSVLAPPRRAARRSHGGNARLDLTLLRLRKEVNDLLTMLG